MPRIISPDELADLFGVGDPDEVADDLYDEYVVYAARMDASAMRERCEDAPCCGCCD